MISERKKYDKLADHIYSRYTMKHELNFTVKVTILMLCFCVFMIIGYVYYFLKNYGFSIRDFIYRVPIIFMVSASVFTLVLLFTIISNLLYMKFAYDEDTKQAMFDRYLRNEFKILYSKGKVEKYEIFRFYLFDSLDLYGINASEFEEDLDAGTKKSIKQETKRNKANTLDRNKTNRNKEKIDVRAGNSRTNAKSRDRSRK